MTTIISKPALLGSKPARGNKTAVRDGAPRIDPTSRLGEGTIVRGDVEIEADAQVGSYCIIEGSPTKRTIIRGGSVLEDFVRIHPGVDLGEESRVGAYTVLGHPSKAALAGHDQAMTIERVADLLVNDATTRIGPRALIRSHGVIYTNVSIGERFSTGHSVMIREHTRIGERCVFGTHASVDGYCRMGDRCHIGQYAQLSQSARIGKGVFIGGQTVFSDNRKAVWNPEEDLYGPVLEDYVRVGLNCTLLPEVTIGRHSFIGAGSVVSRSVPADTLAYGNPARIARTLEPKEIEEYIASVEG